MALIDYRIRFWSIFIMTLTLNVQGQILNLLYLSQNVLIAKKRKAIISIELKAANVAIRFQIGHDPDLAFSRSNMEFAIFQPKIVWLPHNENQIYRLNSMPMLPSGLSLDMTLKGDVAGVTSDIGVPSTRLVLKQWLLELNRPERNSEYFK